MSKWEEGKEWVGDELYIESGDGGISISFEDEYDGKVQGFLLDAQRNSSH